MSIFSVPHLGFVDDVSHSTQNLVFVAWAIYTPTDELICLQGIFHGHTTNNIVEYSVVIEILYEAISLDIHHLVFRSDSQLMVKELANIYSIRNPTL